MTLVHVNGVFEQDPRKFPERYFYNPDKIFKIWPEVYDNPDKNRRI